MKKKNILICGIRDFDKHNTSRYFFSKDNNEIKFSEGLVSGVGEAKKILSSVAIDEIIAIGSSKQCKDARHEKISISDGSEFFVANVDELSEFDYFRYRLSQFVRNVDIEQADFFNSIKEEKRNELISKIKLVVGEDLSSVLVSVVSVEGVRNNLTKLFMTFDGDEIEWCMHYLYSCLADEYKMKPLQQNIDIPISFIPISASNDFEEVTQFHKLLSELLYVDDTESNLYVDMHSFSIETSFVCLNTLFTLSDDINTPIYIRGITNAHHTSFFDIEEISLQERRYRTEKLMNGIRAFLDNGKTDILVQYWDEAKEDDPTLRNEYIDKILCSMRHIDAGISLCNTGELEKGVYNLKKTLNHPEMYSKQMGESESLMVMMIKKSIAKDFGPLMEGNDEVDTFELIKWAYKKKFYQQVVTLIESQAPAYFMKKGILYPFTNDEEKQKYYMAMNAQYYDLDGKDRWWFNDLQHYFFKSYGRFGVDYRNKSIDTNVQFARLRTSTVFGNSMEKNVLKAHSLIDKEEVLYNVLFAYYDLSKFRNSLNHAEGGDSSDELEKVPLIWKNCGDYIVKFIDSLNTALENIGDKKVENTLFNNEEFMDYVHSHNPRDVKMDEKIEGYSKFNSYNNKNIFHNKPFNKKPFKGNGVYKNNDEIHINMYIPNSVINGDENHDPKKGITFHFDFDKEESK